MIPIRLKGKLKAQNRSWRGVVVGDVLYTLYSRGQVSRVRIGKTREVPQVQKEGWRVRNKSTINSRNTEWHFRLYWKPGRLKKVLNSINRVTLLVCLFPVSCSLPPPPCHLCLLQRASPALPQLSNSPGHQQLITGHHNYSTLVFSPCRIVSRCCSEVSNLSKYLLLSVQFDQPACFAKAQACQQFSPPEPSWPD